jgi:hypothetical protein
MRRGLHSLAGDYGGKSSKLIAWHCDYCWHQRRRCERRIGEPTERRLPLLNCWYAFQLREHHMRPPARRLACIMSPKHRTRLLEYYRSTRVHVST